MTSSSTDAWAQALVDYVNLARTGVPDTHRAWTTDMGSALLRQIGKGDVDIPALREFIYRTEVALSFDDVVKAEPLLRILRGAK